MPESSGGDFSGSSGTRFYLMPHVVSARHGDATVLMDQKRGTYFTLTEVAGRAWELIGAGAGTTELVEQLLEEYDVSRSRLEQDIDATLRLLVAHRLMGNARASAPGLERYPATRRPRAPAAVDSELPVPSVLGCGLMILVVKMMLRVLGLDRTRRWIQRRVCGFPERTGVDLTALKEAERRVAMAGALYPGRAKCLEQSLVLYYALGKGGIHTQLRIGVQPFPFLAHAWVEYGDIPINDVLEHVQWFTALPDPDGECLCVPH